MPHLSPEQRAAAEKVVVDVEAIAKDVEAGKLTGTAQNKKVALAIKELQTLQQDWLNSSTAGLQRELAAKKALLKKDEAELKLAGLEKELAEKKLMLKKLVADKDQAQDTEKQHKEDAAQEEMVSKLLATAKALAASNQSRAASAQPSGARAAGAAKAAGPPANPALAALVADLEARERNVSASITRDDAEEKTREAGMARSIDAAKEAPSSGKTDAMQQGQKMLQKLVKQEHRNYLKARALKESQRQELAEGIRSIQKGDAATLSHLMEKMQKEQKNMQAKAKNFLY